MSFSFANNVFSMGSNGFSTANRYPRQVANGADTVLTMVQGPSIKVTTEILGSNPDVYMAMRFECGDLTFTFDDLNVTPPAAGFAVDKPVGL